MSAHDPIMTVTLEQALAVVLEIDGSWSVIPRREMRKRSALEGLELPDSNAH